MIKKFLWIVPFAFLLIFNQIASADTSFCRTDIDKMVKSINLDDNQKAKIKPIIDQLIASLKATGSQFAPLETQVKQQVNSTSMDQSVVNSLVDQKAKLIGDMMKAKLSAQNQIFNILNPQQREKLRHMLDEADKKMAEIYSRCDKD